MTKKTPTVAKSFARRFVLNRKVDVTGTSGTGTVAEGILFSNGKVALTWFSHYGAVNVYDSMEVVKVLHGHSGSTEVVWLDNEVMARGIAPRRAGRSRRRRGRRLSDAWL